MNEVRGFNYDDPSPGTGSSAEANDEKASQWRLLGHQPLSFEVFIVSRKVSFIYDSCVVKRCSRWAHCRAPSRYCRPSYQSYSQVEASWARDAIPRARRLTSIGAE